MTNGKVKIPQKVMEAIDKLLGGIDGYHFTKYGILAHLDDAKELAKFAELRVLNDYYNSLEMDSQRHPNELMRALVNGYEVEKTPEEKVRDYYGKINALIAEHRYSHDVGVRFGIEKTLDLLGIKIEGVNA
ncbi:hypothetical protein [Sporosarcina sp. SAFN-015]|uniref:hypothetical protein n=1 Tax=Sporosarcina sp. SAFN-015 TaxID=3387274 RepID=UPI003F7F9E5E